MTLLLSVRRCLGLSAGICRTSQWDELCLWHTERKWSVWLAFHWRTLQSQS